LLRISDKSSFNPVNDVLYAYKMGLNSAGQPQFTLAGKGTLQMAGEGVPTVTSLNGQAGTGIVSTAASDVITAYEIR
jgi:hypothetical protein